MYVNDAIALVVVFLSLVVIVLGVRAGKKAEQAISRTTLTALVMAGAALLATGILSLKLVSEVIGNNASNRIVREELHSQLKRIENSILALDDRQSVAKEETLEKIEHLNQALHDDWLRDSQDKAVPC